MGNQRLTLFIIQGLYRDYTTPKRLKAPTLLLGSKKAAIKTRSPPPLKEALELVEAQAAIRATPRPPLCGLGLLRVLEPQGSKGSNN